MTRTLNDDRRHMNDAIDKRVDNEANTDSHADREPEEVRIQLLNKPAQNGQVSRNESVSHSVPTDRGWAWVVLLAVTVLYIIVVGYMKCRGIMFVEWQHRFHSSASATTVITMLQSITCSILSLLVMTVGMRYMTCRTSVMIGATVGCGAYIVTAFATDIRLVYLSDGVVYGVAIAFMIPAGLTIINLYFMRYRGLANSIALSGVGIGGLSLAPVLTQLFAYYGYTGTFMLAGGLLLNVVVCGALLRPLENYRGRTTDEIVSEADVQLDKLLLNDRNTQSSTTEHGASLFIGVLHENGVVNGKSEPTCLFNDVTPENEICNTLSEGLDSENSNDIDPRCSEETINVNNDRTIGDSYTFIDDNKTTNVLDSSSNRNTNNNSENTASIHMNELHTPLMKLEATSQGSAQCSNGKANPDSRTHGDYPRVQSLQKRILTAVSTGLEFRLLKNPVFICYLIMTGFLSSACALVGDFLVPHAKDMGVTNDHIAILLIVSCGLDVVSKLVTGYISDRKWIRRSTLLALSSASLGIAAHMMTFMKRFETILVFAIAVGMLQGIYFAQTAAVMMEYMSLDELKGALGFTFLLQGFANGASQPVAGALRDVTGSYAATYHYLGLLLFVGAALCACLPVVQRWHNRRNNMARE